MYRHRRIKAPRSSSPHAATRSCDVTFVLYKTQCGPIELNAGRGVRPPNEQVENDGLHTRERCPAFPFSAGRQTRLKLLSLSAVIGLLLLSSKSTRPPYQAPAFERWVIRFQEARQSPCNLQSGLFSFMSSVTRSTNTEEPTKRGTRWCRSEGTMSKILSNPSVARPPACSASIAIGLHSYSRRSLPLGSADKQAAHY